MCVRVGEEKGECERQRVVRGNDTESLSLSPPTLRSVGTSEEETRTSG